MTPEQQAVFDSLMGGIHRVAVKIAEIADEHERARVIKLASKAAIETAAELGLATPNLEEVYSKGIETVVREIVTSRKYIQAETPISAADEDQ